MKFLISLFAILHRSPEVAEGGSYTDAYGGSMNEQALSELGRLTIQDFAVGMSYRIPQPVGRNRSGEQLFVMRTRKVSGSDLLREATEFISAVNGGIAYADEAQVYNAASGEAGGEQGQQSNDSTPITQQKTTLESGVQNDSGKGEVANNTTNQIQAEQVAHTIGQTTELPDTKVSKLESAPEMTTQKTTLENGVQDDSENGDEAADKKGKSARKGGK